MEIQIKKLHPDAIIPERHSAGAAAFDLHALVGRGEGRLINQQVVMVRTGIAIHIKDPGVVGIIAPRSGLGKKGITLANTIGVIDSDYQGEIMLAVRNTGMSSVQLEPGDRIAQLLFVRLAPATFSEVEAFAEGTPRGSGGFGSTGTKKPTKGSASKAAA